MYNAEKALLQTKGFGVYKTLLFFYPTAYRKRFGEQILITFQDMHEEEVSKHGKVGFGFWLLIFLDITQSVIVQHISSMKQQGLRKYFHITTYNILGGIMLLPFALLFAYDLIGRIMQGDLNRYNRLFENQLSHSFIYANYFGKPLILMAIAIVFPALAVLINLIPLFASIVKTKKLSLRRLFLTNPIAVFITIIGLFFLFIIFGHDVVPCMFYGLTHFGFGQFGHIVAICRNA